ncbi:MAG: 5'-methylthioadenosine/adenosylhomocysteine nucleosidase [Oscillospiraceae bacterium]|nr:5'-methylthioadenosine/adenosylhomocysteine nucleosidase [Oscillospiraceae bacterium]
MTKLGIIGAMQVEVEILLSRMENQKVRTIAGSAFYEGTLEGLSAVVVQCGVGKVNAAICAQILCDCFGITHLVNTGIAGSLSAQLDIGDLVVSTDAMYHDFDCVNFGYEFGRVPGMDTVSFAADPTLIEYALTAAEQVNPGHCRTGRIASGDQFVADKALKEQIIARTQGLCTEMEGAAIAQTAFRNGLPFVILRAISDKADDSAEMDYPTFERIAAHRCAQVTCHLAKQLRETE